MSAPTTSSPRTKTARRARIAAIIATRPIGSQEELGHELAAEGIHVTQGDAVARPRCPGCDQDHRR